MSDAGNLDTVTITTTTAATKVGNEIAKHLDAQKEAAS